MRSFLLSTILIVAALPSQVFGQAVPAATSDSVTAKVSPFTDQLRKTIAFIRVSFTKGGEVWEIKGTGFFVSYSEERLGKQASFVYLVTNRHMALPGCEEGQNYPIQSASVRLNLKPQLGASTADSVELK